MDIKVTFRLYILRAGMCTMHISVQGDLIEVKFCDDA